ncbi:class I SAM-dependent methyltransferase [Candidatus Uhrbacteria bacterium]|nr:class I SAM-dependent methyltransferase [Candidatus Uhrbacteria bacterium]
MDSTFAQIILDKNTRDYDAIATAFSETRGLAGETIQLFADQIPDGARVLDVGCGNGRFLDAFAGRAIDYTGLDVSSRMIAQARARNKGVQIPHRFIVGDMLALPFPDAAFDAVIEVSAFHHIPSNVLRVQAVREFARVLKPGGRLFLTDWNLWQPRMILRYRLWNLIFCWALQGHDRRDVYVQWKRGVDQPIKRYIHVFSLREVRHLMRESGFIIEQQYYSLQGKPAHWWNGHRLVTIARK